MDGIIYAGGAFRPAADAAVSVFDHGLLYGDGVFEGIRAYNRRVFRLERHIERLFESARAIRLEVPATREEVEALVVETCRRNHIVDGYIRLIVTRGAGDLGLDPRACPRPNIVVIARAGVTLYKRKPTEGITAITSSFRRNAADATSPAIKSLNYLNNVLARIEASDRGADEAILLDHDGHVAEATADNVFIVKRGQIFTPPITAGALRGGTLCCPARMRIAGTAITSMWSSIRPTATACSSDWPSGTSTAIFPTAGRSISCAVAPISAIMRVNSRWLSERHSGFFRCRCIRT